mmetsp:Transcript_104737/g.223882  ORF Transcript_104737/g.223882 Transcript_104737/m.223882 type:complete len:278 (-) Transcript_104737:61-894(-)
MANDGDEEAVLRAIDEERAAIERQLRDIGSQVRDLQGTFDAAKRRVCMIMFGLVDAGTYFSAWLEATRRGAVEKKGATGGELLAEAAARSLQAAHRALTHRLGGGLTPTGRAVLDRAFVGWRVWAALTGKAVNRNAYLRKENERLKLALVDERLRQEELQERYALNERKNKVANVMEKSFAEEETLLERLVVEHRNEMNRLWHYERDLMTGAGQLDVARVAAMLLCISRPPPAEVAAVMPPPPAGLRYHVEAGHSGAALHVPCVSATLAPTSADFRH